MNRTFKISVIVNDNKVAVIKMLRDFLDIGLKEAKDIAEKDFEHIWSGPSNSTDTAVCEMFITDEMLGRATRRAFTRSFMRSWKIHRVEGAGDPTPDLQRIAFSRGI